MHTIPYRPTQPPYPMARPSHRAARSTTVAVLMEKNLPLLGKKTEVLHYYRAQQLQFLNLGSVLISLSDRVLYHFNRADEVDWVAELPA